MIHQKVKNVLLLSHEMSRTGAPVALHYMAKQLKEDGIFVTVLSEKNGPMTQEMQSDGITVIIDDTISGNMEWLKWACNYDLIVVCTVVPYHNIEQLMQTNMPVIWWIHDAEMSFQLGANALIPHELTPNIHVFGGGEYCCRVVDKYRPSYHIENLLYCVPDYSDDVSGFMDYKIDNPQNRFVISSIASIDKRKGQDILVESIEMLPKKDVEKSLFLFVGKDNDEEIYSRVRGLKEKYPDNVALIEEVSRRNLADVYRQSGVVVCTSRDDPMPVIMTESLMLGIPILCSDKTGTYSLIEDGVTGYKYFSENREELRDKLSYMINNPDTVRQVGKSGRKVYEEHFTKDAFKDNLYRIIGKVMNDESV